MQERRKENRRKMAFYFQVLDGKTEQLFGHLTNVSSRGLMLDCMQRAKLGQTIALRIDTPAEVSNTKYINFVGQVKWCQEDPVAPNMFNVGIEIVDISAHDSEVIKRMLDLYASQ